jgi:hypothetical protein
VFSYDKALDENKYKESLESDTEYKEEPQDEESPWSSQPIKKFDFKTKKVRIVAPFKYSHYNYYIFNVILCTNFSAKRRLILFFSCLKSLALLSQAPIAWLANTAILR